MTGWNIHQNEDLFRIGHGHFQELWGPGEGQHDRIERELLANMVIFGCYSLEMWG